VERGWPFYLEVRGERLALNLEMRGERLAFYLEVSGDRLDLLPGSGVREADPFTRKWGKRGWPFYLK
jgi:hypothetical protein